MSNSIDKIKDNIRAMLNLARNDGAAEGEIANALAFAQRLMDTHNLSEDDLDTSELTAIDLEKAEFTQQFASLDTQRLSTWEGQIGMFVCKFIGGVKCYHPGGTAPVRSAATGAVKLGPDGNPLQAARLAFYGVAEDVELAVDLFHEIRTCVAAMARIRYGSVYRGVGREYCEGFASGLWSKIKTEQSNQLADARKKGGNALVLVEKRNELVAKKREMADIWLRNDQGIKLGKRYSSRSSSIYDPNARAQGRRDGQAHNTVAARKMKLGYNGK